jgi:hypothetical protein
MNETQAQEDPRSSDAAEGLKIAVVLRDDLETWQKLNVAAFTISGVASQSGAVGEPYRDADGNHYLPMFKEPVLVFATTAEIVQRTLDRARSRGVHTAIFTEELFQTFDDVANRAAVAASPADGLRVVGLAFRSERKTADKILKGLKLHA